MVNKVILIGRLGRDPEMRYTGSGTPVCNFSLATDEVFRDKGGERQKRTEWHRVVAWAKLAEQCSQLLKKGSLTYIEGQLRTREWNDREGNKRRTTEIVAFRMRILTPKGEPGLEMEAEGPEPPEATAPTITDEDVPF
ncbi:MAG: single-stranded DNA-binding protein [Terriglobia bacterium]